jgi:endonuclease YncB( thermonuclease family)
MGNTIHTTASSISQQLSTLPCISCCISVPEPNPKTKDKYETYTDEIATNPKQGEIDLILAYHTCTCENTPTYSYENLKKLVKILKVVDGDTIDIALHSDDTGKIFKHRVRMYGIDTPEMHPSLSNPDRLKEIEASKQAKEALTRRLQENDNLVVAHFHKFDKYGRLMATLHDKQGEDINKWMITSGHAQEYFGKTKKKFVAAGPALLSASEHDYFETPRTSELSEKKEERPDATEDFEEFPDTITEEAKHNIRIVS